MSPITTLTRNERVLHPRKSCSSHGAAFTLIAVRDPENELLWPFLKGLLLTLDELPYVLDDGPAHSHGINGCHGGTINATNTALKDRALYSLMSVAAPCAH